MALASEPGLRWHDMGGLPAERVPMDGHDHALWEKRVDALLVLCTTKGLFTVDGLRRAIEDLPPEDYERLTYYERWITSIARNLVEAGAFSNAELGARMEEVAARGTTYGDAARPAPPSLRSTGPAAGR